MSNLQQAPLVNGQRVERAPMAAPSINQPIAILLWVVACVTTWQLIKSVTPGMVWYYQVGVGIALQAVFTALERPFLRGKPNKVSTLVLLFDTLINAGGAFPYTLRMSATPTVQMITAAFHISTEITPLAAFALALVLGFLLAAAPEAVWRWRG